MIPKTWLDKRDPWEKAVAALLVVMFVIVAATFRDYGVSWDDEAARAAGADYVHWLTSGFQYREVLSTITSEYVYGAFFSAPAAIFGEVAPFGTYENIHLVIALVGLLGIFFTFRVAQHLRSSRAGFLAALILALTPAYYGHSFINQKDLPLAVFYTGAVYALLRIYDHLPKPGRKRILAAGVMIGLPLSIRVGSVMLLGYVVMLAFFWHLTHRNGMREIRSTTMAVIGMCIVAWLVMVVWWPFAQLDPIRNPLYAIHKSTSFNGAGFTNLYRGTFIQSSMLPREYLPVMLLVTLPEFYVAGIVASLIAVLRKTVRGTGSNGKMWFFAFVVAFPIAAAVILKPTVYDVTRLFLFTLPPLAVTAALGIDWVFSLSLMRYAKWLFATALLIVAGGVAIDMIRSHPYQYAYYNRTTGGLSGAYGRFDTEYWGTSYKEGVEWLSRNYRQGAPPGSITVANPSNPHLTFYYINKGMPQFRRFRQVDIMDNANVVLSLTRWNQHLVYGGRVLHVVERMGVPLVYVIESNSTGRAEDSTMRVAISRLYMQRNPAAAVPELRKVLAMNPAHYGATIALATALAKAGEPVESRLLWGRVLEMATAFKDTREAASARKELASTQRGLTSREMR